MPFSYYDSLRNAVNHWPVRPKGSLKEIPMSEVVQSARIILEDGTEYEGNAVGHSSSASGEILFYTGQGNLSSLLTDPALKGSILVLSDPVAGIGGIQSEETDEYGLEKFYESRSAQISGLVLSSYQDWPVHPTGKYTLARWLKKHQVPGIYGIDTRALVQRIRSRGSMRAKILVEGTKEVSFAQANLHTSPAQASIRQQATYGSGKHHIMVIDCGSRNSAIRSVIRDDTTVVRVPATQDFTDKAFEGVLIAGGPGDPTSAAKTVSIIERVMALKKPIFATGNGAVILAIAAGASAYRMAHGHRGENIPCMATDTAGQCLITAQNHGYGIREDSFPADWQVTWINKIDSTIEGFADATGLFAGVLFHPEGSPGPSDGALLYDRFLDLVRKGGIHA